MATDDAVPPQDTPDPDEDFVIEEATLDALLVDSTKDGDNPEPDALPDDGAMDQSAIDALTAESGDSAPTAEELADDSPLDQAALDALIGAPDAESEQPTGVDLRQEDLDTLVTEEASSQVEMNKESDEAGAFDQGDIDALPQGDGASAAPEPNTEAEADGGAFDQGDIDALPQGDAAPADAAPSGATEADGEAFDQGDIAALFQGDAAPADAAPSAAEADGEAFNQGDIDALLQEDASPAEKVESAVEQTASGASDGLSLSQDLLDGLLAQGVADAEANDELSGAGDAVGGENVAAAAPPSADADSMSLSQDMLDSLIADAQTTDEAPASEPEAPAPVEEPVEAEPVVVETVEPAMDDASAAPETDASEEEAPAEEPATQERAARAKFNLGLGPFMAKNGFKIAASLLAGAMTGLGVYTYFSINPTREPNFQAREIVLATDLTMINGQARDLISLKEYGEAVQLLDGALALSPEGPLGLESRFLHIEAGYKGLSPFATDSDILRLQDEIKEFVVTPPTDEQAARALFWQGRLYERQGIPMAARQTYDQLLRNFSEVPNRDRVLYEIGRISLDIERPAEAAVALRRLLQEFPGSGLATDAKILLGDAFRDDGERAAAEALYRQVAETLPNTVAGGRAFGRLGRMAYERGDYAQAIRLLEERRQRATVLEGNDEVFLLLGQSYRASGRLAESERVLRELIDFFPESPLAATGFVELSQVLEGLGRREQAVKLAVQASQRFPEDARVLENAGAFLGLAERYRSAAESFLAADNAGADDARVLLAAGKAYRDGGQLDAALQAFDQVVTRFSASPETVEATVAMADMLYRTGQVSDALDRLESLALTTEGQPQRLPVLTTLAGMYRELGLTDRAADLYTDVASLTSEPELLARCATSLLEGRRLSEGRTLASRVDLSRVNAQTAYELLMAEGAILLTTNSQVALERMEQAHQNYQTAKTEDGEDLLFKTYLATNNVARARAMVSDLEGQARQKPILGRTLRRRALAWADFNFDRGDYKTAGSAYSLVLDTAGSMSAEDVYWATFQKANTAIRDGDAAGALGQFDAIGASPSPWAEDARHKAEYLRTEQRLRHEVVTPAPTAPAGA
jgi:tetratricopeptide (TPR) repeat protein